MQKAEHVFCDVRLTRSSLTSHHTHFYLNLVDMNVTVKEGPQEILNFMKIHKRYSSIRISLA